MIESRTIAPDKILADLSTQGFSMIGRLTDKEMIQTADFLLSRPVFQDAHVPQTSRNRGQHEPIDRWSAEAMASECVCVPTEDATIAPNLFEYAVALTPVASVYLGMDPAVCYSANVFWTRPGVAALRDDIQAFHVDQDDERFLAMFCYLADVLDDADGPQDLYGPDGKCRTITGPAGTIFLADTSKLHRGRKPMRHERGLAWFRWGVSERPPANAWDKIEPIPAAKLGDRYPVEPKMRDAFRLLVTP